MNDGTLIWMILFGVFATIFFVIAAVISIRGVAEIKELFNDPDLQNDD
jgi:hypothetical protein|tara:strand:+ start:261 stop:404 length:144 start_codon:yes stop_codon:yes gene_type:complete